MIAKLAVWVLLGFTAWMCVAGLTLYVYLTIGRLT